MVPPLPVDVVAGRRPRVPRVGAADAMARWSETAIAFARLCPCGIETAIAFAGEIWAFAVQFSGAEVMPVSMVPSWGRAVVLLVSMSPCLCVLCAKFFAQRAQNTPHSACLRVLGECFAEMPLEGGVPGELFRGSAAGGVALGEFFVDQQSLDPTGRGTVASVLASGTLDRSGNPSMRI